MSAKNYVPRENVRVVLGKGDIPIYTKVPKDTIKQINELREFTGGLTTTKIVSIAVAYLFSHKNDITLVIDAVKD